MIRNRKSSVLILLLIVVLVAALSGCASKTKGLAKEGDLIIKAEAVKNYLEAENTVLVDMQEAADYAVEHLQGAINITRGEITVNEPFPNLVAPADLFAETIGAKGIDNDTLVIAYDNANNMDAARLWWTMKYYGYENVKVVSGGKEALLAAGLPFDNAKVSLPAKTFNVSAPDEEMMATTKDVREQVNDPVAGVVLLDTRSIEEFNEGTIPNSILFDYVRNNFSDGTYRPSQHLILDYIESDVLPQDTIIIYCKTSIRGAQTYLALYNAGYRNLKLYDGAWVEYSSYPTLPIQLPEDNAGAMLGAQDMS